MSDKDVNSESAAKRGRFALFADRIDETPELAAARDYGVDVAALLANLDRPVAERIRRHQIALDTFNKLRNARKL